jgi:glutathione S-transferase
MQLYGTPPSHFTRKVRVLLQELGVPYEFVKLEKILETGEEKFASNPLHLFPVLVDGTTTIFDSDAICEYLIERFGAGKGWSSFYPVAENRIHDRQRMVIINGGMSAGVSVVRARRSGIEDWSKHAYLRQEMEAIGGALRWLEKDLGASRSYYPGRYTMLDISLQCLVEWAQFREMHSDWSALPNLTTFVRAHASRPSLKATHPSLAEVAQ